MRVLDLALKDLRQVFRDRRSLVFLVVMPVIFTFFFGFMFANQESQSKERLVVGVVNQDADGRLSQVLIDLLDRSDTVQPEIIPAANAAQIDSRILKGELAGGLIIPQGFSAGSLAGEKPQLEIVNNEETPQGQTVRRALQTTIGRVAGMIEVGRSSLKAYETQAGPLAAAARSAYQLDAVNRAAAAWKTVPLAVEVTSKAVEKNPLAINPYNQYSPGMIVQFTIFGLSMAAMVLVTERRTGAMARLLTTPMTKAELIAGHILGMFIVFFVQQLLLVIFGQLVLKVNYLAEPLATLLIISALALWVSSLGLLISTLSKKEDQVALYAMIAMFVFSALGGAWFSLEMVGKTFATIGHLMPTAWAIDGYQNIAARGLGLSSVMLPVSILIAYTAAFFGIAIWKFKYE